MKTKRVMLSVLGMGFIGLLFAVVAVADDPPEKVELCHVPPGDTSAAHTITVSVKATESHLAKHEGDFLGACASSCGTEDACDDGNMCTSDDCVNGACVNEVVDCDDGDQCTADTCNPATGCENTDVAVGTPCDLGNPCSLGDECQITGVELECFAVGFLEVGTSCDDGIECTTSDQCVGDPEILNGVGCIGFVEDCNDECIAEYPRVGGRLFGSPACDDGDLCTPTDHCGFLPVGTRECQADAPRPDCPCSSDSCDPATGFCPPGCSSDADCPGGVCCGSCCCPDGQVCCGGSPPIGGCQDFCGPG